MVNDNDFLKIIDFGISDIIDKEDANKSFEAFKGTLNYMAPEGFGSINFF